MLKPLASMKSTLQSIIHKNKLLQRSKSKQVSLQLEDSSLESRPLLSGILEVHLGINNSTQGSEPIDFVESNGTLYYKSNDGTSGRELWKINSLGNEERVSDINAGLQSSYPIFLFDFNNTLYFSATDENSNWFLWRVNAQGLPEQVLDGDGNTIPTTFRYRAEVNGTLYFATNGQSGGNDLWKINSSGVAERVTDASLQGYDFAISANLVNVNGTLYFIAFSDINNTHVLWKYHAVDGPEIVN